MLAFFDQRHLLAPADAESAALIESAEIVLSAAATPECPARSLASAHAGQPSGDGLIVRALVLPADPSRVCRDAPSRDLCESVVDGCQSTEDAIFCDRRWIAQILALAAVSRYALAESVHFTSARAPTVAPDKLSPSELTAQLIDYWTALRAGDQIEAVVPPPLVAKALATGGKTSRALAKSLIVFGVGHELAHVRQRTCPGATPLPPEIGDRYEEFTCGQTSNKELAADMAGIDVTRRVVLTLRPERPTPPADLAKAIQSLYDREAVTDAWVSDHWADNVTTTLIHYAEASALQAVLGEAASGIVRNEPALGAAPLDGGEQALLDEARRDNWTILGTIETDRLLILSWYYGKAARTAAAHLQAYEHHLPMPYRLYLLQVGLAGSDWDSAGDLPVNKQRGLRFAGILREMVRTMQVRCARRSEQEKERLAGEWLGGKFAGRRPTYFGGNRLACRLKDLLRQVLDGEITLTAADMLRGDQCSISAAGRVNVRSRDSRFVEFEYAGTPGATLWTHRDGVSHCPRPRPHNVFIGDSPTKEQACELIRIDLHLGGRRREVAEHLVEYLLNRATSAAQPALRADVAQRDHCLIAEMRHYRDTEECVIELQGSKQSVRCAVDTAAFVECWKAHEGPTRSEACSERVVCQQSGGR